MKRWLGCLTLALIGATTPAAAFAGGVFFGFGGGYGDVSFDDDSLASNRLLGDDNLVGEWLVGYRFDSKFVIEGGGTAGMSFDTLLFGDFFTLSDQRVMAGYAFQPAERFSIIPKAGVSFWDFETGDGFIPIFGGQRADANSSGSDWIWRVSFEWHAGQRLRLYGAYTGAHYDFGDSSAPSFGFKFQF